MSEKITAKHLDQIACVYVRQSTRHQMRDHRESQRRQYSKIIETILIISNPILTGIEASRRGLMTALKRERSNVPGDREREHLVVVDPATLEELDTDALVKILTEPKNSLTKQYAKLFDMEDVEVDFREDALRAVAQKAMERKTGARGLRSILEAVLLETMYHLPSSEGVSKVVIDESVIAGESEPMLMYENVDQAKAISED